VRARLVAPKVGQPIGGRQARTSSRSAASREGSRAPDRKDVEGQRRVRLDEFSAKAMNGRAREGERGETEREDLEEENPRRGAGGGKRVIPRLSQRTLPQMKALRAGQGNVAPVGNCRQRTLANRREGNGLRRGGAAVGAGKPLKGEPWTWLRGEINPQGQGRKKPSRA